MVGVQISDEPASHLNDEQSLASPPGYPVEGPGDSSHHAVMSLGDRRQYPPCTSQVQLLNTLYPTLLILSFPPFQCPNGQTSALTVPNVGETIRAQIQRVIWVRSDLWRSLGYL